MNAIADEGRTKEKLARRRFAWRAFSAAFGHESPVEVAIKFE
ncbi:hypothetical protein [Paraburkholderia oxyphila]|nr:hypothetical protein [Paraburkholderia oxyphila]